MGSVHPRERGARRWGRREGRLAGFALSEFSLFLPAAAFSRGTALGGRACQARGRRAAPVVHCERGAFREATEPLLLHEVPFSTQT